MPAAVLVIRNLRTKSNVGVLLRFLSEAQSPIRIIYVRLASHRGVLRDSREWYPEGKRLEAVAAEIQSYIESGEEGAEVTVVRRE